MARGSLPGERRGGRQKGTPNKTTKALKEMILGALSDAGGQDYLARMAVEEPGPFMTLLGKVLPTTLAGDPAAPLNVNMTVEARQAAARAILDHAFGEAEGS